MAKEIKTGLYIDSGLLTTSKMGYVQARYEGMFKISIIGTELQKNEFILDSYKFELPQGNYTIRIFFESTSDKLKIEEQSMQVQIKEGMITVLKYALGSNYKSSLELKKIK